MFAVEYILRICRGNLPQLSVVEICRGFLSRQSAEGISRRYLAWQFVMVIGWMGEVIFYVDVFFFYLPY